MFGVLPEMGVEIHHLSVVFYLQVTWKLFSVNAFQQIQRFFQQSGGRK